MIKFKRKEFTIQEGHYTGPKDMEKTPSAVEVIGKGTLGGAVIGGIVGKVIKDETLKGMVTGGKWGFLGGVLMKMFLNYLHNPMTTVKYQEVDKNIRQFGIVRAAGITIGDTVSKRASIDEKFSFNDREVTGYKLNFAVSDNQVTMYTYGLSQIELDKLNKTLDYYCKKFVGMEYSSALINSRLNSYAVSIVFTNYQAIGSFILELSDKLETKINLLDNKAFVTARLEESVEDERAFSVKEINKYDLYQILGKTGKVMIKGIRGDWKHSLSHLVLSAMNETLKKISDTELTKNGVPMPVESFGNPYLEDTLKKLHYVEGFHYTVGDPKAKDQVGMAQGRFIISSTSKDELDSFWKQTKSMVTKSETPEGVVICTYTIKSRKEFEFILKKLMQTKITFNIFEG